MITFGCRRTLYTCSVCVSIISHIIKANQKVENNDIEVMGNLDRFHLIFALTKISSRKYAHPIY